MYFRGFGRICILETYKQLQNKEVKINGFKGKTEAEAAFARGLELYKAKYRV